MNNNWTIFLTVIERRRSKIRISFISLPLILYCTLEIVQSVGESGWECSRSVDSAELNVFKWKFIMTKVAVGHLDLLKTSSDNIYSNIGEESRWIHWTVENAGLVHWNATDRRWHGLVRGDGQTEDLSPHSKWKSFATSTSHRSPSRTDHFHFHFIHNP